MTPKYRAIFAPIIACAAALTGNSYADTIMLDNGDRISGTVDNIGGGNVTITTPYAGAVTIAMANVTNIETEGTYDITLASGTTIPEAQLVNDGVRAAGSVTPASLADIAALAPPPDDSPIWTSRVDALATLSNGNADTQTLSLIGDSLYSHGKNEHHVSAYWGDEEADGETTKEQLEIDYGYRRYLRDDWFLSGNVEYFKDGLKQVDSRWTVGVGVGKLFWDNATGRFSVELGVSQVFEDLAGESENNPALRWALNYNRFITPRTEFYHTQEILKILDSDRGEVYDTSTGFRLALTDALSISLRADLRHETDPPEGAHNSDITYGVGVGYTF